MNTKKFFWGLFFILAAIFIVFSQLGFVENISIIRVTGGIIFLAIAIEGLIHLSFSKVVFSLAFIGIIFASELGIESITPWPILIVALFVSIGLGLIFPHHHKHPFESSGFEDNVEVLNDDSETINCYCRFGGCTKYINSEDFKQANVSANFGGMKLYFNNVSVQPGTSPVIRLDCSFSGVEIYVPYNWKIENHASSSFGAIDEKNQAFGDDIITVTLVGNTSFCGVEITHS